MFGIEGLLAGRTLMDRYLVEEVIGRGGMGAVYRARDQRLGRDVAVKVVSVAAADADAHARLRARFHREARSAAQLHHPNVVSVFDFGTDPALGLDFLVMELLRGEDLATRLSRKGPPALNTALGILFQAASGLAAGHRAGLIHRDVKPGNLFLEPGDRIGDVRVKVLDFGIAEIAAADDATVTHLTVVGRSPFSPAFASPEQLRGESRLSPATDVFSLGAVAYQLLTGERAFSGSDPRGVVAQVASALAALPNRAPRLPQPLRAVLQRALAPEPGARYPSAAAFADAIAPFLSDREVHLRDEPDELPRPADVRGPADQTRLLTDLGAPVQREVRPPAQRPAHRHAEPPPGVSPELQLLLERRAAAQALANGGAARSPAIPESWARRTGRAVWSFVVTVASVGLLGACWAAALAGLDARDLPTVYGAAAASVLLAPLALHRVTGSRGSLRLALFASIVGSIATVYFLGRRVELTVVLATLCVAQVLLAFGALRMTRRSSLASADPRAQNGLD